MSVEAEEADPASSLALYRDALRLRRELHSEVKLEWLDDLSGDTVLAFARPGGWVNVTNFGAEPVALPDIDVEAAEQPARPLNQTQIFIRKNGSSHRPRR